MPNTVVMPPTEKDGLLRSNGTDAEAQTDEGSGESNNVTMRLVLAVFIAALTQFSCGYNTGVMNAPVDVVFPGHSLLSWSLAVSAFGAGGPFGSLLGGALADYRGRRGALIINMWTFVVGGLVQTLAPDIVTIIVGRFIIGFASGASTTLVPIYLGEVAPPSLKGSLGSLTQFAFVIGILFSDLLAFPFATLELWRVLFAFTIFIAILQLALSPFLLESPRWLLNKDHASPQARDVIRKFRGLETDEEVEREAKFCLLASAGDKEKRSVFDILKEMYRQPDIRHLSIAALVLTASAQLGGGNAPFYYSQLFFKGIISNPLVATTALGAVNVVATFGAVMVMDRCGRKFLMLVSTGGMIICCILIILALLDVFDKTVSLVGMIGYVIFFEVGMGPVPWLLIPEMFETKYLAVASSGGSIMSWFTNFLVGLIFPFVVVGLGPYSFAPFAVVLTLCFFYCLFYLPETHGTSPDQLLPQLSTRSSASATCWRRLP